MDPLRRRRFLGFAAAWLAASAARAQPAQRLWRVGFLSTSRRDGSIYNAEFESALKELGYVEGRNLRIEWRHAEDNTSRLPALAAELVAAKVDVIVSGGTLASKAAKAATASIPIVFASVGDPLGVGLVKSLARPEANVTGFSNQNVEIGVKRLEILLTLLPKLRRVALLLQPENPNHAIVFENLRAEGEKRRLTVLRAPARSPQEIESAFELMRREKAGAVLVSLDPLFQQQRAQIADLAKKHRLPSMTAVNLYAEAGCLISYGARIGELFRRAATYVDKILKGAKPAELPVEQPTSYELIINLRTARAIGVGVPRELIARADHLIE